MVEEDFKIVHDYLTEIEPERPTTGTVFIRVYKLKLAFYIPVCLLSRAALVLVRNRCGLLKYVFAEILRSCRDAFYLVILDLLQLPLLFPEYSVLTVKGLVSSATSVSPTSEVGVTII